MSDWISRAITGGIVFVIILVFGTFLMQTFYNAMPVNNSSIFYYGNTVQTYWPVFLTICFIAYVAYVGFPVIGMIMGMVSGGDGGKKKGR